MQVLMRYLKSNLMFALLIPIGTGTTAVAEEYILHDVGKMVEACPDRAAGWAWCAPEAVAPDWLRGAGAAQGPGLRLEPVRENVTVEPREFYLSAILRDLDRRLGDLGARGTFHGLNFQVDIDREGADMLIDVGRFDIGIRLGQGGRFDTDESYLFLGIDTSD